MQPVAVVVGAGPGIGMAVARRFAGEGYAVALVARQRARLDGFAAELRDLGATALAVAADLADPDQLDAAWATIVSELADPDVLVYNAAAFAPAGPPTALDRAALATSVQVNVIQALHAAQLAAPAMRAAGRGTILFTGGGLSQSPMARAAALSIGKAGIRSLAFTLAEELAPEGIRVGTVTVCGAVAPGTHFDPDRIADEYWTLHTADPTPPVELVFD